MRTSLVVMLCIMVGCGLFAHADTITVASLPYCPYVCTDAEGTTLASPPGFMVEILSTIVEAHGHTLQVRILPWPRAIAAVTSGQSDGLLCTSKPETPDLVFPDEELAMFWADFWGRAGDSWRYDGVTSLTHVRLGWMRGYPMGDLEDYITQHQNTDAVQILAGETAFEQQVRKLVNNRIDVFMEDRNVALYQLKQLNQAEAVQAVGEWFSHPGYIAFSPDLPEAEAYARMVSEGIQALRESGELERLLQQYGLQDWKE